MFETLYSTIMWSGVGVLSLIGLIGCIYPYPGHLFLLAATCWIAYDWGCSWWIYVLLVLLAAIGFMIDTVFTFYGAKRFGSSKKAIWCSLLGLLIGSFFFPFGLILGPFLGAFIAELIWMQRDLKASGKSGLGALVGFMVGSAAKVIIGLMMLGIPFLVFL